MRGSDERTRSLFTFVDLKARDQQRHPLRKIRQIVNEALASLDGEFSVLYVGGAAVDRAGEACCAPRCCRRSSRFVPSVS